MLLLQAAVPAPIAPATIRAPFTFGSLGQPSPFTFGSLGQPSPFTFGPQPAAAAVPSTSTFGFGGVGGAPGASPAGDVLFPSNTDSTAHVFVYITVRVSVLVSVCECECD